MLGASVSKNSLILGAFALITAGILAGTFFLTKDKISAAEERAAKKALLAIIPPSEHDNDMLEDVYSMPQEAKQQLDLAPAAPAQIHIAKQNGEAVAVIIPSVAPDGYSGEIKLLVGIRVDGSVAGVRVLSHKETPGLGDKIDLNKSDWILSFNGKSLDKPEPEKWTVKKNGGEFDQFTGATITPRAVVQQVKQTLEYFKAKQAEILNAAATQEKNTDE